MTDQTYLSFDTEHITPLTAAIATERLISGSPVTRIWNVEKFDDGQLLSGIWEATTGAWRVEYDKWEFCNIISGTSILTEDGKEPRTVTTGDSFVIRPGFKGIWNVVETTRKFYVIRRSAA
ncbi:MAG: cupin domain-containing protein [Brucellaceae bacterium]|jgi:uncharacterized cupin superfamily protein|nr:cupin domain-containing protein [Brucellaceae bacterium]